VDGHRFDQLTRVLASMVTRRTALKAVAAAFLSRELSSPVRAAQPTCPIFEDCAPDGTNRCIVLQDVDGACMCAFRPMAKSQLCSNPTCLSDAECPEGQYCATGWCGDGLGRCHSGCEGQCGVGKCPPGTTLCFSQCVDVSSDPLHCGSCGAGCTGIPGPGQESVGLCVDGQCRERCREDADRCGDNCTDLSSDPQHCGGCGKGCAPGQSCCGGECIHCGENGVCCGGRCLTRDSGERFCDWCGYLTGWPQGCQPYEFCDRGLCVSEGVFQKTIVLVTCPENAGPIDVTLYDTMQEYIDHFVINGCIAADGVIIEARASDGRVVTSGVVSRGLCVLEIDTDTLPLTFSGSGLPAGYQISAVNELRTESIAPDVPTILVARSDYEGNSGAITAQVAVETGGIEIHVVDCPPGFTGPDFYGVCHDNGDAEAHWNVIVTGAGEFREILSTTVESWPGPAVARIEGLASGTYGVNLMTKFVGAPAYVFCSPDAGQTVLVDQFLEPFHDPISVPVDGQHVVCDWNLIYP
jgi:hypothetical protein